MYRYIKMSIETINYAQIMCENKTKRKNDFIPMWFLDDSLTLQTHCLIHSDPPDYYVRSFSFVNNWIEFTYLI